MPDSLVTTKTSSSDEAPGGASAALLLLAVGAFLGQAVQYVPNLETWLDEGLYLMRGWWYVSGAVEPYSAVDPTSYMPLYFLLTGIVEAIFGIGHTSVRISSAVLGIGSLLLVFQIGRVVFEDRMVGAMAALLLAANPIAVKYMISATPYSVVTFCSLLTFLLIWTPSWRQLQWRGYLLGFLFFVLFFLRPNMIAAIGLMSLMCFLVEDWQATLKTLARAFAVFAILSLTILLWFGRGLWETTQFLPVLSPALWRVGLAQGEMYDVLTLTLAEQELALQWSIVREVLRDYYFATYPAILVGVLLGATWRIVAIVARREWRLGAIDACVVYFAAMTVVHLIGSQTYCPPCIVPYANYFLVFGALVAAWLLNEVRVAAAYRSRAVQLAALAGLTAFVAVAVGQSVAKDTTEFLMRSGPQANVAVVDSLERVATELAAVLPDGETVFALSDREYVSQAVFLAGGVVEPASLSLLPSYRVLRPDLDAETHRRAIASLRGRGLWTDEILIEWVRDRASVVVTQRTASYRGRLGALVENGLPLGDLLAERFELVGEAKGGGFVFEVYRRRSLP